MNERFTASADGIRQDFIIGAAPDASASELVLGLAVQNATVSASEKSPDSVVLTLDSGRRLAYSRLHVMDATGKELPARMEAPSSGGKEFRIIVAASDARYPVTIDPTITDEDWESMNPGMPGVDDAVSALAIDASGNLYAGGWFYGRRERERKLYSQMGRIVVVCPGLGDEWYCTALAVDASGNLYAGGDFTTAGGVSANHIAKWDGTNWSALGSGMNSMCIRPCL